MDSNVPVGAIIENSSSKNDAYIIAHKDLIGTKRPTRYVSIVDENNLSADVFHSLTYELCSTYARATTSVAVVPPSKLIFCIIFYLVNSVSLL
jgi:eukaryotic translation initiation factor 2C